MMDFWGSHRSVGSWYFLLYMACLLLTLSTQSQYLKMVFPKEYPIFAVASGIAKKLASG